MAQEPSAQSLAAFKSDDVSGLVDETRLGAWLDERALAPGAPLRLRRISGGMSNESLGVERGSERWVLRRPAKLALEGADRGMRREFRLLSALDGTPVPHPRPVALCEDLEVAGCVFYLMEHVDGFVPGMELPEPFASDAALRGDILRANVRALGELARVDWQARGLGDYGKPQGFHERQVGRWTRQLDGYGLDAERAALLAPLREIGSWLDANRPADDAWTPAILHGDYHVANVMMASDPPARVAAILDWENSTIGDPALDLAGYLRLLGTTDRAAWAPRDELIACWEETSGRRAPDLRYYTTLSAYKLSVMLEGIYQRSKADPTRETADGLGALAVAMMNEAHETTRS